MYYKNVSYSVKTFYGVTFEPGEIKNVDRYINNVWLIPVGEQVNEQNTTQKKPSSESKKEIPREAPKPAKQPEPSKKEEPAKQEEAKLEEEKKS